MKPYEPSFKIGDAVRIAPRTILERFRQTWKYHNPLQEGQLQFAGHLAVVQDVGIYHGGDVIYSLEALPGVWHEDCLSSATDIEPRA